jgi:hypothetical protein
MLLPKGAAFFGFSVAYCRRMTGWTRSKPMTDQWHDSWISYEKIRLLTSSRIFNDAKGTMHHFSKGTILAVDYELQKHVVDRRRSVSTPDDCQGFIGVELALSLVTEALAERIPVHPESSVILSASKSIEDLGEGDKKRHVFWLPIGSAVMAYRVLHEAVMEDFDNDSRTAWVRFRDDLDLCMVNYKDLRWTDTV